MKFAVVGTNFQYVPIAQRELVSFSDTKKLEMYACMENIGILYGAIVSTCNRSEIYFLYEKEEQLCKMKELYLDFFHMKDKNLKIFHKQETEALTYMFEVCAGLQSLVVGEDQILGQMAESIQFAKEQGKCNKVLHKLFQEGIRCAKAIHRDFKISEHPLSIAYIGILQLMAHGGIKGKTGLPGAGSGAVRSSGPDLCGCGEKRAHPRDCPGLRGKAGAADRGIYALTGTSRNHGRRNGRSGAGFCCLYRGYGRNGKERPHGWGQGPETADEDRRFSIFL